MTSSAVLDLGRTEPVRLEPEQRFVLHGVPWATYVMLRDSLDDQGSGVRLTYLEGTLELMSPSGTHEEAKKLVARLLEAWAEENDVDLNGHGSETFRKEAKQRGLEADECYSVGPFGEVPQIAIEVIVSSSLVDKLSVYAGLRIPEVWIWRNGRIAVHQLTGQSYAVRERSELLPALDLGQLESFVRLGESQTRLVKAYRAAIRAR